jgi:N-acetylmuramoyl-L-alanine amidase
MTSQKTYVIDPGHVGGPYLDMRYLEYPGGVFREGEFSFHWANLVRQNLEDRGLRVELTREHQQPSHTATDEQLQTKLRDERKVRTLSESLKRYGILTEWFPDVTHEKLLEAAIRNEFDLANRCHWINTLRPRLCLSLHLNGDATGPRTLKNGVCILTNRKSAEAHKHFKELVSQISERTRLPLAADERLEQIQPGLFANESLILLKHVQVPIALVEGPYQNNETELPKLVSSLETYLKTEEVTGRLAELVNTVSDWIFDLDANSHI